VVRCGNGGVRTDGGDAAGVIHKNGAVLDGRRRDGMDPACADAEHPLGRDADAEG
jgi:hypothetical protein